MFNKFKKGHRVIVYGPGQNDGKFYRNVPAIIIERDSFYKDYLVKFNDGSEDWIEPNHLRKPFERGYKKYRKRKKPRKKEEKRS